VDALVSEGLHGEGDEGHVLLMTLAHESNGKGMGSLRSCAWARCSCLGEDATLRFLKWSDCALSKGVEKEKAKGKNVGCCPDIDRGGPGADSSRTHAVSHK